MCSPSTKRSKYSNCTVNSSKYDKEKSVDTLPSSPSSMLNSLLWSETDAIISARDPMQNPGQTRICYNPGQTHLTRLTIDPNNPDDPTRFQPCSRSLTASFVRSKKTATIAKLQNYTTSCMHLHACLTATVREH